MTPYYERDGIVIYHGDSREIAPKLPPSDLVVTSPPYGQQRTYGRQFQWGELVPRILATLNVSENGQLFINLGLVRKDGEVVCYWDQMIHTMRSFGFRLFDWYVWDQGSGLPGKWGGHFAPSHEWVFHFNRNAVEANKCVPCKTFGQLQHGPNMRTRNGASPRKTGTGRPIGEFKVPDSVIRIPREYTSGIGHPAVFPIQLARHLIVSFDGTVLDPFAGSGSTLIAAQRLGRAAIGIEINEEYCEIAAKRLEQGVLPLGASA